MDYYQEKMENGETYSIVGRIKQFEKNMVEQVSNLESTYLQEQGQMSSEKEVERILEVQRDNCYVSIYNKTQGDQNLAKVPSLAPNQDIGEKPK